MIQVRQLLLRKRGYSVLLRGDGGCWISDNHKASRFGFYAAREYPQYTLQEVRRRAVQDVTQELSRLMPQLLKLPTVEILEVRPLRSFFRGVRKFEGFSFFEEGWDEHAFEVERELFDRFLFARVLFVRLALIPFPRRRLAWATALLRSPSSVDMGLQELARIGTEEALIAVVPVLEHAAAYFRYRAVQILIDANRYEFLRAILPCLEDQDEMVRLIAVRAVGLLGNERHGRYLHDVLLDKDPDVRVAAARALEMIGAKKSSGIVG
jgi:hypothetical protein